MTPTAADGEDGTSKQDQEQDSIFSSQKSTKDYVTLEGIENRTGIEKENVFRFILKELLDNAVDFLETQHNSISQKRRIASEIIPAVAQIEVTISKQNDYLSIVVSNSNEYCKAVFYKDTLHSIFNFNTFYSSKRNQYKITRGALGDALKEILCIPYALVGIQQQQSHTGWNEPLIIKTKINKTLQTYCVYLVVDKFNQTIHTKIIEQKEGKEEKSTLQSLPTQQQTNFTEIEVRLPIVKNILDIPKLRRILIDYTTFNTHIDFVFNLPSDPSKTNQQQNTRLSFPQEQSINSKWTSIGSIYYYTFSEFQNFVFGLDNNDLHIYEVLQKTFREGSNMKKTSLTAMTVGQLKQSPDHINELYTQMRKTMEPLSSPSNLMLPFNSNKKARMNALRERIQQKGIFFSISDMKYKSKYGYYKLNNGSEFPFFFEIAVVHSNNILHNLDVIESLNSSAMPGSYSFMIGADDDTFHWQTQSDKRSNNSIHTSRTIFDILDYYGYSHDKDKCKKPQGLIILNLISPRIDYKSYGKSIIDLEPFVDLVAETTVKACSGGLNSRISLARINGGKEVEDSSVIGLLRRLLRQRFDLVKQDPSLNDRQKWTQSTVFYHLRQILLSYGYSNEEIDRQYITSQIKAVCEKYLGVKREEIGITAADRAQLYFKGKYYDVGLEEISDLIEYGTDMLIVEKEGVVKQLAPFSDEKGIALLNTRGFLTEYASILSEQSHKNGCNIAILTDFDASGLLIANGIPNVYRIGIDFDTLNYFGLSYSTVEESYKPKPNHLKPLQKLAEDSLFDLIGEDDDDLCEEVEYVSEKRIEIDSVMAALNDNSAFWGFVLSKLEEKFPTRNYNRAIDIPEYVTPDCLRALNDKVREKSTAILEKERIKMKEKFSNVKGFLNVKQYDRSVPKQLKMIIEHDKTVKPILQKIEDLVKGDFLK